MKDANITVLTWARNESYIMPFFLRHYDFADRIIVYDNGSDDGTQDIVKAHPKAELRHWDTGGVFDEIEHTRMKESIPAETGPGWKIVVDTDEFVWHPRGMAAFLDMCTDRYVNMVPTKGFDMVSEFAPEDDGKTPLTEIVKEGIWSPRYSKPVIFKSMLKVRYGHGCHSCSFDNPGCVVAAPKGKVFLLHYHWIGRERVRKRTKWMNDVFDKEQKKMGLGWEAVDVERQISRFNYIWIHRQKVLP